VVDFAFPKPSFWARNAEKDWSYESTAERNLYAIGILCPEMDMTPSGPRSANPLRAIAIHKGARSLVAQAFIDDIFERFALFESLVLAKEELHGVVEPVLGVVGAVR